MGYIKLTGDQSDILQFIDEKISDQKYDEIIDLSLKLLLDNLSLSDESSDFLYELLEKITLICDKTPNVMKKITSMIKPLLITEDEWIHTESLIIIEKISKIYPEFLEDLTSTIQDCLNNKNNTIREISLKIIGNLILTDFLTWGDLLPLFFTGLEDNYWKIRKESLLSIRALLKNHNIGKDQLNTIINTVFTKVGDDNSEVQELTFEILKDSYIFFPTSSFQSLLLRLLDDNNSVVCEKGVILIGNLGYKDFLNVKPILFKLLELLKNQNLILQPKIIETFVKISYKFPLDIVNMVFNKINDSDQDFVEILIDILIYVGLNNLNLTFDYFLEKSYKSDSQIIGFLSKMLRRLSEEKIERIEEQCARLLGMLENSDWRLKLKIISFLAKINDFLNNKDLAIWFYIKFKDIFEFENDPDVKSYLNKEIEKIPQYFEDFESLIKDYKREQNFYYKELINLQNFPGIFRDDLLKKLDLHKFKETKSSMEDKIGKFINKIDKFDNSIHNYKYKRLDIDLIDDWVNLKQDLFEQIGDIRNYISPKIEKEKKIYANGLKKRVSIIKSRIDVLIPELEYLAELNTKIKELIINGESEEAKKNFEHLTNIRNKIFRIESEIGQLWIGNLEFKDEFKNLTIYWTEVKIETQQLLYTVSYTLRDMQRFLVQGDIPNEKIKIELSFELMFNDFQNLILKSTRSLAELLEQFEIVISPIYEEIKVKEFDKAKNLLDFVISQTRNTAEEFNKEILKTYSQLDNIIKLDVEKSRMIRNYLNDWQQVRESLSEKSNEIRNLVSQEILLNRIHILHDLINPIPISLLIKRLKIPEEAIFNLLEEGKIIGHIKDNKLYLPEQFPEYDQIISIYPEFRKLSNKNILFSVNIQNNARSFLHELSVLIIWPKFFNLDSKDSSPKLIEFKEFPPEFNQKFKWKFEVISNKSPHLSQQLREGEIRLIIHFRDTFNVIREKISNFEIIMN